MSEGSLILVMNDEDPYTHVPNQVLRDTRMTMASRGFFALLLGLPKGRSMSVKYFSRVSGLNRETVYRHFAALEKYGYVKRTQQRDEHGSFSANLYELHASPCMYYADTVNPDTANPNTDNTDTKEINNKNTNPPISPKGEKRRRKKPEEPWLPDRFEAFWVFYRDQYCAADHSRAGNKARAKTAWNNLKPDKHLIGKMGAYLLAELKTEMWKRGIGIPYASTFLNSIARKELDLTPAEASPVHTSTPAVAAYEEPQEEAFGQWH